MCLELEFLVVAGNEDMSEVFLGDMPDEMHVVHLLNLLMVTYRHSKEQFVVLTAIQGTGGDVHIQLFSHHCRLVVDGNLLLEDATAHMALLADVHELAAEAVRDVHHSGGTDACLAQFIDDVATGLSLQLTLEKVFLTGEVGRSNS